jgi:bifunctional DNA-binding transcriptional regulator/antitoxin component of YhaV-PrlF toxin-antitoxin module
MKITSKGQVTIPEAIRREYGFLPDTEVSFIAGKEGLVLKKGKTSKPGKSRGDMMVERLRGSGTSEYSKWTTDKLMKLLRG